jgi:hypothetical protein
MIKSDFENITHFSYEELEAHYLSKGYPKEFAAEQIELIDEALIICLDLVREKIKMPIIINSITDGVHSSKSWHYKGKAIDWHPVKKGKASINYNRVFQACIDAGFLGVGWYPYWNRPGFHTDLRSVAAFWVRDQEGKYKGIINNVMV